jgi:hypothetical protein
MRFKMLMLSSLLILAFLVMIALSVNWNDPSYDADAMFSENEEIVHSPQITPWASRELQKNKSSLDWTMPSTLTGSGESAKQSREQSQSSSEPITNASAEETATSYSQTTPTQTEAMNVQGTWYFILNDSVVRDVALTLLQNNSDVYGSGRIKEGNESMDVAVSGTAAVSELKLNLVSRNPIVQYKLNLTVDQDKAAGEYKASSADGKSWMGTAEGEKTY